MELSDRRDATPSTPYTRSRDAEDGMGLHSTFRPQERSSWGLRGLLGVLAAGALAVVTATFHGDGASSAPRSIPFFCHPLIR